MKISPRLIAIACLPAAAVALTLAPAVAQAQTWPAKAIRLVEPAGPGSAVDVFARKLAPPLGDALGQSIVIDNRPGASDA